MKRSYLLQLDWLLSALFIAGPIGAQEPGGDIHEETLRTLRKAAAFYREKVASHGGYVYYCSVDLKERWGEGKVSADTIFVQPPGTPTVGMAYLDAYEATGDPYYRDAAREAALALVHGQLESGGWTQIIHFGPRSVPGQRVGRYRHGKGGSWNASSLDDGQTQSALLLLIRADRMFKFEDAAIHEAARYGLDALLRAQFPCGAFPQVWTRPVEPRPVRRARFPEYDWRTEGRVKNYWDQYTLNDNLAGAVSDVLIAAHRAYGDARYRAALEKLGDFLVLAQMPEPQPGWCQQYSETMVPIWARKFEPPAVTGWESQDVLETLIKIAQYTGKPAYLEPVPRALAYLRSCLLPDGRIARYYELRTNRPLYMDAQYRLTHDDSTAPSHYGWKQPVRLDAIETAYQQARRGTGPVPNPGNDGADLEAEVRRIVQSLDDQGRWVSSYAGERLVGQPRFATAFPYLSSARFGQNVEILSRYLAAGHR